MKHEEFKIGTKFVCGVRVWRCTDVGTRVITAIRITSSKPASWFNGPPYAVDEVVFDENDLPGCTPR